MKYLDKNIKRKSKIVTDTLRFLKNTSIPLPSVVEISDSGTCNRSCVFCPRSDPKWIDEFDKKNLLKLSFMKKYVKSYQNTTTQEL